MEIILIEGKANAGKSTLTRCLTGIGYTNNQHPNCMNVLLLDFTGPTSKRKTLVIPKSLNEGISQDDAAAWQEQEIKSAATAIPPWQVATLLDAYHRVCGAEVAILCVSATALASNSQWNAKAYANFLSANNGQFGTHPVTHIVSLNNKLNSLPLFAYAAIANITSRQFAAAPQITRNALAAGVRQFIQLV